MTIVAVGFLIGILIFQQLQVLPTENWAGLLLIAVPLLLLFPRYRLPLAVICGFLWTLFQTHGALFPELGRDLEGVDIVVTGEIASLPEHRGRVTRFVFDIEHAKLAGCHRTDVPRRIRLNWYTDSPVLSVGQRWKLTVRIKRPWGFKNPGGFDYEKWLFEQGIRATGYVRTTPPGEMLVDNSWHSPLDRIRQLLKREISTVLDAEHNRGVILALAIGVRSDISQQTWTRLLNTGTNHLLAISGLHIGLVAGFMYFIVFRVWRWSARLCRLWPVRKTAAVAAIISALMYAALAGFSLPTQRALIMLSVVLGAALTDHHLRPSHALSVALLAVLIWDSSAVLAVGFWLSFTAVALIAYGLANRPVKTKQWWALGRIQWLLFLGLLPLTLLWFQRVAVIAPVANLFAVPWVSFLVIPLILLGVLALPMVPAAAKLLFMLASGLIDVLWWVLAVAEKLPLSQWFHAPPQWTYVPAVIGVLWIIAPRGWPARTVGVPLLLPLVFASQSPLQPGEFLLTLLDVGQGLSAVIETENHSLVYDTGARLSERFNIGEAVLVPFLRARQRDSVDVLVISHGDNDHIGGAKALLDNIPVERILTSEPAHFELATSCEAGQSWQWDGVKFEILHPSPAWRGSENDRSCVLRVENDGGTLLLVGDIEAKAEHRLIEAQGNALHSDILLIPHHGSLTSSTPAFIDQVNPALVLVSTGYKNRFGLPKPDIVARYEERGIPLVNTVDEGAITLHISPENGVVRRVGYRQSSRRYWSSVP